MFKSLIAVGSSIADLMDDGSKGGFKSNGVLVLYWATADSFRVSALPYELVYSLTVFRSGRAVLSLTMSPRPPSPEYHFFDIGNI